MATCAAGLLVATLSACSLGGKSKTMDPVSKVLMSPGIRTVVVPQQSNPVKLVILPCSEASVAQSTSSKPPPGSNQLVIPKSTVTETVAVQPCQMEPSDKKQKKKQKTPPPAPPSTLLVTPGGASQAGQSSGGGSGGSSGGGSTPQNQLVLPEESKVKTLIVPPCVVSMMPQQAGGGGATGAGGSQSQIIPSNDRAIAKAAPCQAMAKKKGG